MLLGKRMIMMSGGDVVILGVVITATGGNYMKYKKVGEHSSTFLVKNISGLYRKVILDCCYYYLLSLQEVIAVLASP